MNKVKEISQFKRVIYVVPEQEVLKNVNFVFFSKGDETLKFSPMARELFDKAPQVVEVQIYSTNMRKNPYINIRLTPSAENISQGQMQEIENFMNKALATNAVIDEKALLAWAAADENKIKTQQHPDRLDQFSADYLKTIIVPAIIEGTKNPQNPDGHKAELTFVRYIDDGEQGMKLGIAMGAQCKGCTTSFLKTVNITHKMLSEMLDKIKFPKDLTGVVILPNVQGSPSMTVPAQRGPA